MRNKDSKPGRTAKITEPMNAVELLEIELEGVTGGCARCGCDHPDSLLPKPASAER